MMQDNPRYWRFLEELAHRPLKFSERRVLETLLHLTHGRGLREIHVHSIARLAVAVGCRRSELSPLVDALESAGYLGRDTCTGAWWLQNPDLWPCPLPDPEAAVAIDDLVAADEQRRRQLGLWPPQPTAADFAVEGVGNSDAWTARKASEFPTPPLPVYARAPEPGSRIPDNQEVRGKGTGLDHRGWTIFRELVTWCTATGEACDDRQRRNWGWRVWTRPVDLLAALELAKRHVADGKKHRSRFGLVKSFWRARVGDDKFAAAPPRSAVRLHGEAAPAPPAGGVHASGEVGGLVATPPPALGTLRRAVLARIGSDRVSDVMPPPPLG